MSTLAKAIYQRREMLYLMVSRNLKIRYKSSSLGFLWSLLTPLFFILIYALFAKILNFSKSRSNYLPFLVIGIVVWQYLALCLNDALNTVIGNANLIKKISFPRIILPLSMVVANLINFFLTLTVLFVYLVCIRSDFSHLLFLPVILLTQTALCLGLGLILSALNVFFRDTEHILGVFTLAWFFLTPIFYPLENQFGMFPHGWEHLTWLTYLNPMTGLVCAYRSVLISEGALRPEYGISFAVAWSLLLAGGVFFQKCEGGLSDEM